MPSSKNITMSIPTLDDFARLESQLKDQQSQIRGLMTLCVALVAKGGDSVEHMAIEMREQLAPQDPRAAHEIDRVLGSIIRADRVHQ